MAQAMASMAGLGGNSQAVIEQQLNGSTRFNIATTTRLATSRPGLSVRAQQADQQPDQASRRAMLGLVAAGLASGSFVQAVLAAEPKPIKIGPPPPPSGGLKGTLNSDQPRDLELPLKDRFFLQPKTPEEAAERVKESAKDILGVKEFIDKNEWPYVMNDLRLKAEYLRYDLNTIISSKPKEEKRSLKELTGKLFDSISQLDHAAKIKSKPDAEKYYARTVSTLNDVLAKIG